MTVGFGLTGCTTGVGADSDRPSTQITVTPGIGTAETYTGRGAATSGGTGVSGMSGGPEVSGTGSQGGPAGGRGGMGP